MLCDKTQMILADWDSTAALFGFLGMEIGTKSYTVEKEKTYAWCLPLPVLPLGVGGRLGTQCDLLKKKKKKDQKTKFIYVLYCLLTNSYF